MAKDKSKSAWSAHQGPWRREKTRRELIGVTALAGAMALLPTSARSQERFPTRNVRIIVPFPAGATNVGRLRPKRGRGERRRSRRIARRRPSREGSPRRLHALVPQHHLHDDH